MPRVTAMLIALVIKRQIYAHTYVRERARENERRMLTVYRWSLISLLAENFSHRGTALCENSKGRGRAKSLRLDRSHPPRDGDAPICAGRLDILISRLCVPMRFARWRQSPMSRARVRPTFGLRRGEAHVPLETQRFASQQIMLPIAGRN